MDPEEVDNQVHPALILFNGQWPEYEEVLHTIFLETIASESLQFQGTRVAIKRHPEYKNKHFVFWHLISEGEREEERTPDFRRCERLPWVNWVIQNAINHPGISWWENQRGTQVHIVIWYEVENYVVVLAKRNGYYLLKTAYLVSEKRARGFTKERNEFNNRIRE